MRQYLAEGVTGATPFVVDRSKPFVTESRPSGSAFTKIPGRFSVCDCINGNNRRYSKRVWEKNLSDGSPLMDSIAKSAAFGLLEHPKDGTISLLSPISHQVTSAKLIESKGDDGKPVYEVVGEISIYDTEEGRKLKALIEGGYNPLVSSRGYGSLVKAPDGVDEVQEDYVCESWDVVIKPSFSTAELKPMREPVASTTDSRLAAPPAHESNPQKEQKALAEGQSGLKESPSKPGAAVAAATTQKSTMELSEIKSRLTTLRGIDATKLDPTRVSESLQEVETLHQEVATFGAADPKRAYEAHRLHQQLDAVANRINEAVAAPRKQAAKLHEHNTKLMKVINAVAATALTYRKKLGESLGKEGKTSKIVEELTRRGQGWHQLATERKEALGTTTKKFETACEALDIMAKRYHEDTTALSRRLLQLEFKQQLEAKPALAEKLSKATRMRHVAAVREELEGKKPAKVSEEAGVGKPSDGAAPGKEGIKDEKQKGAPSPDEGKVADAPGKVTNESKTPAADGKKPVQEDKQKLSFTTPGDPRGLNESVEMVRRLSGATANK
jgi:hypothetical protein